MINNFEDFKKYIETNADDPYEFELEGDQWFDNEELWEKVFSDTNLKECQKYLLDNYFLYMVERYPRFIQNILIPLYHMGLLKGKKIMKLIKEGFSNQNCIYKEGLLYSTIGTKRGLFRDLLTYYQRNHIKLENSKNYGDIENGFGLMEAVSKGNLKILNILLANGGDANTRDGILLPVAIKYGYYTIALALLEHGADIHTRSDLAYKTFLKNDDKRWCPVGEELSHNKLVSIFKENNCVSGREKINNG